MTVAEYMRRCAAHYYAARDPLGAHGDFTTAPEISQIFGELIGAWLAHAWRQLGAPASVALCELGPGRGTLMRDALRATRGVAGFHDALHLRMVETSPLLRTRQQELLADAHPRIVWQERLEPLPPLPLLLIANEFFDALPVRQYIGRRERRIALAGDRLIWQPEGGVTRETSPDSTALMARIARHITAYAGAALVVDYGYSAAAQADTLQAMRGHAYADPLERPGEADLTAHVDFTALMRTAATAGAQAWGPAGQGDFLQRLGAGWRTAALCRQASPGQRNVLLSGLERLVAPHHMGELFKVMAVTSMLDSPAGF